MYNESLGKFQMEEGHLTKLSVPKDKLYLYMTDLPKRMEQVEKVINDNKEVLDKNAKLRAMLDKYFDNIKKMNEHVNYFKNENQEENQMLL